MMKKLLLLALILALAPMAGATLSMNPGGGGTYDMMVGETLTIQISDDSGIQAGTLMYIIIEDAGSGALSNAVALPAAGNLGDVTPYSEAGWGTGYELASGSTIGDLAAGVQFTVDISGVSCPRATVSLWDGYGDFSEPEDSITIGPLDCPTPPEPATIALLSCGGLFLRRRK